MSRWAAHFMEPFWGIMYTGCLCHSLAIAKNACRCQFLLAEFASYVRLTTAYFEHCLVSYHTAKAIGKNIILSGENNKTKA